MLNFTKMMHIKTFKSAPHLFLLKTFGIGCCLLFLLFVVSACAERNKNKYLIPKGYVGWVRIYYGIKTAPALPIETDGLTAVLKIGADGKLLTSNEPRGAEINFYYYEGETLTPIKTLGSPPYDDAVQDFGSSSSTDCKTNIGGLKVATDVFFSGTKEQYKTETGQAETQGNFRAGRFEAADLKGYDDCGNPSN